MMSSSPFTTLLYLLLLLAFSGNAAAECVEGDCTNGQGSFSYQNGALYRGDFKNGKRHGIGTYDYESGNRYHGEWRNAERTGYGIFYWAKDGEKYVGQFKNGKRHGQGTYYYKSGNKYEGSWKTGNRHGLGLYTYGEGKSEGTKYLGHYENSKRHGPGTYHDPDGGTRNTYYEMGKQVERNGPSDNPVAPPGVETQPLSAEQQQLLEEFGEPPHFELFLVDTEESAIQRNETWYYPSLRTSFTFVDGHFAGSGPIEQPLPDTPALAWQATRLRSQLTPEAVALHLVDQPAVRLDLESGSLGKEIPDTMVMLFSRGVVFGFSNGRLAMASTLPGMQQLAQEARP
ncbi:MAG: hypothetical protein OQL28_06360 [Sedimenticola sp.]|nr:hypothetical protein [Sedimenticola sp.]